MTKQVAAFPAQQHYIPQMLQKRFTDRDGMLWVHDRRRPGKIFRSLPKGIFKEGHIYTVEGPDGTPSDLVERALGQIESAAEPTISRVVEHVRAGGPWDITSEERELLILFLHVQLKRSPEFFRGILLDGPPRDFVERALGEWEAKHGPIPSEEREWHLSPANLAAVEQSARMGALMSLSPRVTEALEARGFMVVRITRPGRSFVLASLPVVRFMGPDGRRDLDDPGVELWLPVAPDVALVSGGISGADRFADLVHDGSIRKLNGELARLSNVIASSSKALIQSLTRRLPKTA